MRRKDQSVQDIIKTLRTYHDNAEDTIVEGEDTITPKMIISSLITSLTGDNTQ